MRKFDYEPAPLVVGLVLGPVMERSFRQALIISQGDPGGLWASSLSVALWGIALFALVLPMVLPPMKQKVKSLRKAEKKLDHHHGDLE
jgi:putative tricarboxylic transport membrane protein